MDCFASDASTLVGDPAPLHYKHALDVDADVEYVKPQPAWDPAAAMRRHMRTKRDRELKAKRSPLSDRLLAVDRTRSRSPAPYPHVSICRSFVKTGSCPYGAACSFDHPAPARAPTPQQAPPPPPPPPPAPEPKTVYLPVPAVPPMFYSTYRRGSNGELIDPALLPAPVQAQKSLYYRTKPCRYWAQDGACPKGDKCTFIHDPSLAPGPLTPLTPPPPPPPRRPSATPAKPPREPHPAWRVVGGGVTLANARAQPGGDAGADSEEEEAVECLTGLSASQSQSQPAVQSQPQQVQQQQPYHPQPQPQPQYASQQGYAATAALPSPMYPTFNPAAPYAVAAPPGQPLFAYAYPAPAYLWPAPPPPPAPPAPSPYASSPSADRRESYEWPAGGVYFVAPAPHALELGVVREEAMVAALGDAGVDTAGLDGSGRPLDLSEGAQPLAMWEGKDGWAGEEEEEIDVEQGAVLDAGFGDVRDAGFGDVRDAGFDAGAPELFAWGAVEHLCWADDVEMEDRRRAEHEHDEEAEAGSGGRRTSPSTPRVGAGRLYELFAANESPR